MGGDAVQLFVGGFLKTLHRCFAVYGVNHHLAGLYALQCPQPGFHILGRGVVIVLSPTLSLHEEGLHDNVSAELAHVFNDFFHIIVSLRTVCAEDVFRVHGVELQNVVVHPHQRLSYFWLVDACGIAQHADFGLGTEAVSEPDCAVHSLGEARVHGGFAVSGKGEHIGHPAFCLHLFQRFLQRRFQLFNGGEGALGTAFRVEAAFAVDAVETADFSVCWKQVDAKGNAEPPALDRTEYGRRIDDGAHVSCYVFLW